MASSRSWKSITKADIQQVLGLYKTVLPEKVKDLDDFRLSEISGVLSKRKQEKNAYLEKHEVEKLIDWKLKHGTFRPTLMKLVKSNTEEAINSTTTAAFALDLSEPDIAVVEKAMNGLTKLRGIGPASASLLLSVYNPDDLPFFSDELFYFVNETDAISPTKAGGSVKIAYSKKEYRELFDKVHQVRDRIKTEEGESVSALDLEMAAYVLARSDKLDTNTPKEPAKEPSSIAAETGEAIASDMSESRASKRRKTAR